MGGSLELTAEGLDPAESYVLRRSLDGQNFSVVGDPFTGDSTHLSSSIRAPPAGQALYQIWTNN